MLSLRLVCVGRLKAGAERELCSRYVERAIVAGRPLGIGVDIREIAEARARQPEARKLAEAEAIRSAIAADMTATNLAFDERGRSIASADFAALVRSAVEAGTKTCNLLVGGPDGLDPSLRDDAAHVVALGAMTWPHQLVRVMIAEQIYRVMTILGGHPYHRA